MAFTSADLTIIESAIATGTLKVEFADGRRVTYQSASDLLKVRALILAETTAAAGTASPRYTLAGFRKG